ncbi:hypothetical protein GQ44DRAFT_778539 [Phaeosphaeriaceae sp. PMI808]|nr:hypothetical protein GQ44DRAFT_778539 [Phaeosphaeriaceae sp. PMI808]
MKVTSILVALAACGFSSAIPTVSDGSLAPRQDDALTTVNKVLDDARTSRVEAFKTNDSSRRRLGQTECSPNCQQCSNGATTKAIAEIAACGIAALAIDAATLGVGAILEAAGFIACETGVIGSLDESLANCKGLN